MGSPNSLGGEKRKGRQGEEKGGGGGEKRVRGRNPKIFLAPNSACVKFPGQLKKAVFEKGSCFFRAQFFLEGKLL